MSKTRKCFCGSFITLNRCVCGAHSSHMLFTNCVKISIQYPHFDSISIYKDLKDFEKDTMYIYFFPFFSDWCCGGGVGGVLDDVHTHMKCVFSHSDGYYIVICDACICVIATRASILYRQQRYFVIFFFDNNGRNKIRYFTC